jgi:hypothetical protein
MRKGSRVTSPTDPVAVQEFAESIGLTNKGMLNGYWRHPDVGMVSPRELIFFYNVVQQQKVAAQAKGVLIGRIDEWLKLDEVVGFHKKRHPAVYKLQLPLNYVKERSRQLNELKREFDALNQHNAPEGGESA